jgi:hypothetical protein
MGGIRRGLQAPKVNMADPRQAQATIDLIEIRI